MRDVYIVGVGMTKFAKHLDKSVKELATQVLTQCLSDTGIHQSEIQEVHFSSSN